MFVPRFQTSKRPDKYRRGFQPNFRPGQWMVVIEDVKGFTLKDLMQVPIYHPAPSPLGPRVTGLSSSQRRELETREEATRSHLWMQQRAAQQGQMQASQAVRANQ